MILKIHFCFPDQAAIQSKNFFVSVDSRLTDFGEVPSSPLCLSSLFIAGRACYVQGEGILAWVVWSKIRRQRISVGLFRYIHFSVSRLDIRKNPGYSAAYPA
jgi:hypothetical protein